MRLIATINGVEVFSDKGNPTDIRNSRIEFPDGSWCDVSTGQVENRGPGTIRIGGSAADNAGEEQRVTERFDATSLDLNGLAANVFIRATGRPNIKITLTGPDALVKQVERDVQDDTLVVRMPDSSPTISGSVQVGGRRIVLSGVTGSNIKIGGSVVIGGNIGTSNDDLELLVDIELPTRTPVRISGSIGSYTIGDIRSKVRMSLSGAASVSAGIIGSLRARMSGASRAEIGAVNGDVSATASGSANLSIHFGEIDDLSVDTSGASHAHIGGNADTAELEASGASNIVVDRVRTRPREQRSGAATIRVSRVG